MATGATFVYVNGQMTQQGVVTDQDIHEVTGTCPNCGQVSVILRTHRVPDQAAWSCTSTGTAKKFFDPAQFTGITTKLTGAGGYKHW